MKLLNPDLIVQLEEKSLYDICIAHFFRADDTQSAKKSVRAKSYNKPWRHKAKKRKLKSVRTQLSKPKPVILDHSVPLVRRRRSR